MADNAVSNTTQPEPTPALTEDMKLVAEVRRKAQELEAESMRRYRDHLDDKNHITLNHYQKAAVGDEEQIVTSYSTAVDFKFASYLGGNGLPAIIVKKHLPQLKPNATAQEKQAAEQLARAVSSGAEKILYKVFRENDFGRINYYHALDMAQMGNGLFYYRWDEKDKTGSPKGTAKITNISPLRVRVAFSDTNWNEIDYWMTFTRITPAEAKERFGVDVSDQATVGPDIVATSTSDPNYNTSTSSVWGSNQNSMEPPKTLAKMVDLILFHDNNKDVGIVANKLIYKNIHNKGYHGLTLARFLTFPNEPWGRPAHFVIQNLVQKLDLVDSKIAEILKAHAAPMIVDKGNVLSGKKIDKRSNTVYTTRPWNTQAGEGIEVILPQTNIGHLLNFRTQLLQSIHDLSMMPPAAFGAYQPGMRSGFAQTIMMQPTLQQIKSIQNAEILPALRKIAKWVLTDIRKYKAAPLPTGTEDLEIDFDFGDPLPKDDAREIQNQVLLVTNKIKSRYMAREDLGIEDVEDEAARIASEAMNVAENPDVALKITQFQMEQNEKAQAAQAGPSRPAPKVNVSLRSEIPAKTALDIASNEGLVSPQQEQEAEPLVADLTTAPITEPGFSQGRQEIGNPAPQGVDQPVAGPTTGPEANGMLTRALNPGEMPGTGAPQPVAPELGPQQILPESVAHTSKV